ncbi:MAG: hypothetical protein F9B45_05405 [Phycisphaera sp. RhM]|nr:hypothetical protein [Phycisphaera sp. RhM]
MLSASPWDVGDIRAQTDGLQPTGLTVVVGEGGMDSAVSTLGESIRAYADTTNGSQDAWHIRLAPGEATFLGEPVDLAGELVGEVVVSVQWAGPDPAANARNVESVGDSLFQTLVELGWAAEIDTSASQPPLHLIGFGAGSAVISEAVERLNRIGRDVDQVTFLDPYDLSDLGVATAALPRAKISTAPPVYDTAIWDNVGFADVYYQTSQGSGGRPLPGAQNVPIDTSGGADFPGQGADPKILDFYSATVASGSNSGFALSRLGGQESLRGAQNFFAADQLHQHSPPEIVTSASGEPSLTSLAMLGWLPSEINGAGWDATVSLMNPINGDFEAPVVGANLPGWSTVPGSSFSVLSEDGNSMLQLDSASRTAFRDLYVPVAAGTLDFDWRRITPDAGQHLEIRLGDQTLARFMADDVDASMQSISLTVPDALRGRVDRLTFEVVGSAISSGAAIHLDNVLFSPGVSQGDVVALDLSQATPGWHGFALTAFDWVDSSGVTALVSATDPPTGDRLLTSNGELFARIIFTDRLGSSFESFSETGQVYLVPSARAGLLTNNQVGKLRIHFLSQPQPTIGTRVGEVEVAVVPDYSRSGPLAVTDSLSPIETLRAQQRLAYLGFVDSSGVPMVVDGNPGPDFNHALSVFATVNDLGQPADASGLAPELVRQLNSEAAARWVDLSALGPVTAGDFQIDANLITRGTTFTTSWVAETIRQAMSEVRLSGISLAVVVSQLNGPAGEIPEGGVWPGMQTGREFALTLPAELAIASTGDALSPTEAEALSLLFELVKTQRSGSQIAGIQIANAKIAAELNLQSGREIATVAPELAAEVRVTLAPPPAANQDLSGAIVGTVFEDHNFNGRADVSETPLPNWTVYLDLNENEQFDFVDADSDGVPDEGSEPWQVTDTEGTFRFGGVADGNYDVIAFGDDGWLPTSPLIGRGVQPGLKLALGQTFVVPDPVRVEVVDVLDALRTSLATELQTANSRQLVGLSNPSDTAGDQQWLKFGEMIDLLQIVEDAIVNPLRQTYGGQTQIDFDAFVASLNGLTIQSNGLDLTVAASGQQDPRTGGVSFTFQIDAAGTREVNLDLQSAWEAAGLVLPQLPTLVVSAEADIGLTLSYNATESIADTLTVVVDRLESLISADVSALTANGTFGFADVTLDGGQLVVSSPLIAEVGGGDPFAYSDLRSGAGAIGVQVTQNHWIDGTLPVSTTIGTFSSSAASALEINVADETVSVNPNATLEAELGPLRELTAFGLNNMLGQLSDRVDQVVSQRFADLSTPLAVGVAIGDKIGFGNAMEESFLRQLGAVRLLAETTPQIASAAGTLNANLVINGDTSINISFSTADLDASSGLQEIARAFQGALAAALDQAERSNAVAVEVVDGRLALIGQNASVDQLTMSGARSLGFAESQQVSGIGFASIDSFLNLVSNELGVPSSLLSATYVPGGPELRFTIDGLSSALSAGTMSIDFDASAGGLSEFSVSGDVEFTSELDGILAFGFSLSPLGESFTLSETTPLDALRGGDGVIIEAALDQHLEITLTTGDVFPVDLRGAISVGDVISILEQASDSGSGPRLAAEIDSATKSLVIRDLTVHSAADDALVDVFQLAAAPGSFAGQGLGILGQDTLKDGVIRGTALHGESLADRFFVDTDQTQISVVLEAETEDVAAAARLGIADVSVTGGTAAVRTVIEFALASPTANGQIGLAEMADASPESVLASPSVSGSATASLPIALPDVISGLSLGADPRVQFTWDDVLQPDQVRVTLQDLDGLTQLQNLTLLGLNATTPISEFNDGSGIASGSATDLAFTLRGGESFSLSLADISTVGDLVRAIRDTTAGQVAVSINPDGRGLTLSDFSEGSNQFTLSGPSSADLGWDQSDTDSDGEIIGDSVFRPSILSSLRQMVTLIAQFEQAPALSAPLPLIGRSLSDAIRIAEDLSQKLDEFQQSSARSLQQLEQTLAEALDFDTGSPPPPTGPGEAPLLSDCTEDTCVDVAIDGEILTIVVTMQRQRVQSIPLQLDFENSELGHLIDINADALLDFQTGIGFQMVLGIDLSDPFAPAPFFDAGNTQFAATAKLANTAPMELDSVIGPLSVFVRNGQVALDIDGAGTATDPAAFVLGLKPNLGRFPDDRLYFSEFENAEIVADLDGAAFATLPLFAPTETNAIGAVELVVGDIADPLGTTSLSFPDLETLIGNLDFTENLSALSDGWDGLLRLLEEALRGRILGVNVPVVGDGMTEAADFVGEMRAVLADPVGFVGTGAIPAVQQALFLGLDDLGFLRDVNDDNVVDVSDVEVRTGTDFVEFVISLADTNRTATDLNFDIGMPALGFSTEDAMLDLVSDFAFDFAIGISRNDGVYFQFDPSANDLVIDVSAGLPSSFTGTGNLSLLDILIENVNTGLAGSFAIDIGNAQGRVKLADLLGGRGLDLSSDFDASIDVDMNLTAGFGGSAQFPSLRTNFVVDWDLVDENPVTGGLSTSPIVQFNQVQISLGSFLGDFLSPIVENIQATLAPLDPVLDLLTQQLPVFDQLGLGVSLLDLGTLFGYEDAASFLAAVADIKDLADQLSGVAPAPLGEAAGQIGASEEAPGDNWIDLGRFEIDGNLASRDELLGQLVPKELQGIDFNSIQNQINTTASPSQSSSFQASLDVTGGGFAFPILENAAESFGMLLGQDATLFTYDMPPLGFGFDYSQFFPIVGPLGARVGGSAGMTADFAFGFDTSGLRQYSESGRQDLGAIFDGFYVSDTATPDGRGADVPELEFFASLTAAAEINAGVARAGAGGGLFANVYLDLFDPNGDGRVRGDEIAASLDLGNSSNNFLHIFETTGQFTAELFYYIEIGFNTPLGRKTLLKEEGNLGAPLPLLQFSVERPSPAAPLATLNAGTLQLTLSDSNDHFRVRSGGGDALFVESGGRSELYSGVTTIVGYAGEGDDTILIDPAVTQSVLLDGQGGNDRLVAGGGFAELRGGDGNDTLLAGAGGITAYGGAGNDLIVGATASDNLFGEAGEDRLEGGEGDDLLDGGDGRDLLVGDDGDDRLFGGNGEDNLFGGRGNDLLRGEAGDDLLRGEQGDDTVIGGLGADELDGSVGFDILVGDVATVTGQVVTGHSGSGRDLLSGGRGNDLIYGGGGVDLVLAGQGSDQVFAGDGDDEVRGESGNDTIDGGAGNDSIFGGAGSDLLIGGWGSDLVYSGETASDLGVLGETHRLFGDLEDSDAIGPGAPASHADQLLGSLNDDELFGGSGPDTLFGFGGSDLLVGGWHADTIYSGSSSSGGGNVSDTNTVFGETPGSTAVANPNEDHGDLIFGDIGSDVIDAQLGNDRIEGLGGDDEIHAGAGNNVVVSLDGNDTVSAGSGDDVILVGEGSNIVTVAGGANRIEAGAAIDRIVTGAGNDTILAGGGENDIRSGDGADLIVAADGNNLIDAGDGDNVVRTGSGVDQITSGSGVDTIHAGDGDNIIDAGDGDNLIVTGSGNDQITAGVGNDEIRAGDGNNTIDAGHGDNLIISDLGTTLVLVGDGNDRIFTGDADDQVFAGGGNDVIRTGGGRDVVVAGDGDDLVYAGTDDDLLIGGRGDDRIFGEQGRDLVFGGFSTGALASWQANPGGDFSWWRTGFDPSNPANFELANGFAAAEAFAADTQWRSQYVAPTITPVAVLSFSVAGQNTADGFIGDGKDSLFGGDDGDWLFGGGDHDVIEGGPAADYIDGGAGRDALRGGEDDDVLRGGLGADTVRGGFGIDQLYGDEGSDLLYGDAGNATGGQAGQRLWGGSGVDTLFAFAPSSDQQAESGLIGDELRGGEDGDQLYGNLRREILIGDSMETPVGGNDFLHGDYLAGPQYLPNTQASMTGGSDHLFGNRGQDQLFGGGGDDRLWGGRDSDWIEGMDGVDRSYGGSGVDVMVLDVSSRYQSLGDAFDGHYGNVLPFDTPDDGAADILLIQGDQSFDGIDPFIDDAITITEADGVDLFGNPKLMLQVDYTAASSDPGAPLRQIMVDWRSNDFRLTPVVEQIQVAGLIGDDDLSVELRADTLEEMRANTAGVTWTTVLNGGPGDDTVRGTLGRDRIDGGPGSDRLYGYAGDDRIWGDFFSGDSLSDTDYLYAGQGNDDLIGGAGANYLYAWSQNPDPAVPEDEFLETGPSASFGVFVDTAGNLYDDDGGGIYTLEDTGLNRILGSDNPNRQDVLFGGTGLDLLYGNGGGGVQGDVLVTRRGTRFDGGESTLEQDDQWKEYAKENDRAWYLGASAGDDTIRVDFVTNPYNPLFGRHLVTVSGAGAFDPRFNGFDSFTAFDNDDEPVHDATEDVIDAASVLLDPRVEIPRSTRGAFEQFADLGVTSTDIVQTVFGQEKDFLAIIVDALDGDDEVIVGETVQKSVWVDAGDGDDIVRIEPQRSFLPDLSDPFGNRNDTRADAHPLGVIASSTRYKGTTFDSARTTEPDIDWYTFELATDAVPGDTIRITPTSGIRGVKLIAELYDATNSERATLVDGELSLESMTAGATYSLRVESDGAIPTEYQIGFELAASADASEPNDTPQTAHVLPDLADVSRIGGLSLAGATDQDYFQFTLALPVATGGMIDLVAAPGATMTMELSRVGGFSYPAVTTGGPDNTATLDVSLLDAATYRLLINGDVGRYEVIPRITAAIPETNTGRADAVRIQNLLTLKAIRQELPDDGVNDPLPQRWFKFTLTEQAPTSLGLGVRSLVSINSPQLDPDTVLQIDLYDGQARLLSQRLTSGGEGLALLDLAGLPAGDYDFRIMPFVPGGDEPDLPAAFEIFSTVVGVQTQVLDLSDPVIVSFAPPVDPIGRRDVILGGRGSDRLAGGSGEDWVFGGAGNDVLTGGLDGQRSDLIFGGDGSDIFQLVPDDLPVNELTGQPFDPGIGDLFIGGAGEDQVLFLGGDQANDNDASVSPHKIRDFVAVGYDRFLHRHRLTSLVWDTANEQFLYEDGAFVQQYAFFQSRDVERTVIDTRGGIDIIHADPGYLLGDQSWGVSLGDVEAHATAYARMEFRGGTGEDVILGGAGADTIYGESQFDYLSGGEGADRIIGGDGDDYLFGNAIDLLVIPTAVLDGTPDSRTGPPPTSGGDARPHSFLDDLASPLSPEDEGKLLPGAALPLEPGESIDLAEAFALEGIAAGAGLANATKLGDVNADGYDDYLFSGAVGSDSYILFGPIDPQSLYRVETANFDTDTIVDDLRVRGTDWSFEVTMNSPEELDAAARTYRAEGQASVVVAPRAFDRAVLFGADLITTAEDTQFNQSADDLVFASDSSSWSKVEAFAPFATANVANDDAQLATDGEGNWVAVVSTENTLGGTIGNDTDILVSLSSDNANSWSAPFALNSNAGLSGRDMTPKVVSNGNGVWTVLWMTEDSIDGSTGFSVVSSRSTDGGGSWSTAKVISDGFNGGTYLDLEADSAGAAVAFWAYSGFAGVQSARWELGISDWSSPINVFEATAVSRATSPDFSRIDTNRWIGSWITRVDQSYDIRVVQSADNGHTWSQGSLLSANLGNPDRSTTIQAASPSGGSGAVVVWQSSTSDGDAYGTDWDLFFSRSSDFGATWSAPEPLNSTALKDNGDPFGEPAIGDQYPRVAYQDGALVAAWITSGTIGKRDILFSRSVDGGQTWSKANALHPTTTIEMPNASHILDDLKADPFGGFIALSNTSDTGESRVVTTSHTEFTLDIVPGSQRFDRRISSDDSALKISVPSNVSLNIQDLSVLQLDLHGDVLDDFFVLGHGDNRFSDEVGYVFANADLSQDSYLDSSLAVVAMERDSTDRVNHLSALLSGQGIDAGHYEAVDGAGELTSRSVGDVNGDGKEDLLVADPKFIDVELSGVNPNAPERANIGRVYLILGGKDLSGNVPLDQAASYIWEGEELGATLYDVGDLNFDGYDEIAFGRGIETRGNAADSNGAVFILAGSPDYNAPPGVNSADVIQNPGTATSGGVNVGLMRIQRDLPQNTSAHGPLSLQVGEFDGDLVTDLAVGTPGSYFSDSPAEDAPQSVPDPQANQVRLFYDIQWPQLADALNDGPLMVRLGDAVATIDGESSTPGEVFGYLPQSPYTDLDGDGLDDLLIGTPNAFVDTAIDTAGAGRVHVVYGRPRAIDLPETGFDFLTNRSIPGRVNTSSNRPPAKNSAAAMSCCPPVCSIFPSPKTSRDSAASIARLNGSTDATKRPAPSVWIQSPSSKTSASHRSINCEPGCNRSQELADRPTAISFTITVARNRSSLPATPSMKRRKKVSGSLAIATLPVGTSTRRCRPKLVSIQSPTCKSCD